MRYERPSIVRREQIKALLLDGAKSDLPDAGDTNVSDVNLKEHIRPVVWNTPDRESVPYATPSIVKRDPIKGLLDGVMSDVKQPDGIASDVNVKDNVVPVRW